MAESSKASSIKAGPIILGLVISAATVFTVVYFAGKGWKLGTK
jgi:hypothetical protein